MANSKKLPVSINTADRRMFLQGLGASLAIPFLPSLLPSKAQAQASTPLPKLIFTGATHGRWHGNWYPGGVQLNTVGPNIQARRLSTIAGPLGRVFNTSLDGIRDKVNIIQGLDYLSVPAHDQAVYTASNRVHYADGLGKNFTPTYPYSIDAVLAQSSKFYPAQPPIDVLRIAPRGGSPFSWEGVRGINGRRGEEGNWLPVFGDTLSRLHTYLNSYFNPSAASQSSNRNITRRLLVDRVLNQFKAVATSTRLSREDKNSLQNYVDHLSDVQRSFSQVAAPYSCSPLAAVAETSDNDEFNSRLMDMMVLALSCGATRIATYELNWQACASKTGGIGCHGPDGVHGCDNGINYENVANWNAYFVKHYANLVRKMDAMGILDSSLVVFANDQASSVPNHHGADLPVITAGSLNGKFRTGEFISYYNRSRLLLNSGSKIQNADLTFGNGYQLFAGRKWNQMMISIFDGLGVTPSEYEREGRKGFGSYTAELPPDKLNQRGNPNSDTFVHANMLDYHLKEDKDSVYQTLPYLYTG